MKEPKNTKRALKLFYKNLNSRKSRRKIKKIDKKLFKSKPEYSFFTNLARVSEESIYTSKEKHKIMISYTSWREMFFKSLERNSFKCFEWCFTNTGATCFQEWNNQTKCYDYIVALNSDVYDYASDEEYFMTLAHELGHAMLDHPSNPVNERSIPREIEADNMGYIILQENRKYEEKGLNLLNPNLISSDSFQQKHDLQCGVMIYGKEGIKMICDEFECSRPYVMKKIADRFLTRDDPKTITEDAARHENWVKTLERLL